MKLVASQVLMKIQIDHQKAGTESLVGCILKQLGKSNLEKTQYEYNE